MTDTFEYEYENFTASEINAFAAYDEAAREYNVVAVGNGENPDTAIDICPTSCACPKCGERDIDNLALDDDEVVTCQTCGEIYDISPAAQIDRLALDDVGFGDDYGPNFWDADARSAAMATVAKILNETPRRGPRPGDRVFMM